MTFQGHLPLLKLDDHRDGEVPAVGVVANPDIRYRADAHAAKGHRRADLQAGDVILEEQNERIRAGEQLAAADRSEEHTSELQSLMRISYAVSCVKNTNTH